MQPLPSVCLFQFHKGSINTRLEYEESFLELYLEPYN